MSCIRNLNDTIEEQKTEIKKLKGDVEMLEDNSAEPVGQTCPAGHDMQEQHNTTQYPCTLCRRYDNDVYYNCSICARGLCGVCMPSMSRIGVLPRRAAAPAAPQGAPPNTACPVCTFMNANGGVRCEICDSSLI